MDTPRFRFTTGRRVVVGVVMGILESAGGVDRLRKAQRCARRGRPHHLYEPAPGCVHVFPEYSAAADGPRVLVDLRKARIEVAS